MTSFFGEDPNERADEGRIFWSADIDPGVLVASAVPADPCTVGGFDLFDQSLPATVLALPDHEELLLGRGASALRLSIMEGSLLSGPVALEFRVKAPDLGNERIAALRRFAAMAGRQGIPHEGLRLGVAARRMLLLQTIDAMATTTSQREIAVALFGAQRVNEPPSRRRPISVPASSGTSGSGRHACRPAIGG